MLSCLRGEVEKLEELRSKEVEGVCDLRRWAIQSPSGTGLSTGFVGD